MIYAFAIFWGIAVLFSGPEWEMQGFSFFVYMVGISLGMIMGHRLLTYRANKAYRKAYREGMEK